MTELLIGTDDGLLRCAEDGAMTRLDGPPSVAFLARGATAVYGVTRAGALWGSGGSDGWRLINERPVPDEVWSLAADPRLPGRLYLGVSPALLYVSDDGGASWTPCDAIRRIPGYERWTFPPPPHIPHVRSIAPDPRRAGAVYIGVEEGGVYRSEDAGASWQGLNEGLYWDVHTVLPAVDATRVYATTGGGFHLSDDGGAHWRQVDQGLDRRYVVPLTAAPDDDRRLFVAGAAGPPPTWARGADAALYRSDDAGEHWQRLTGGLPEPLDRMVRALAVDGSGRVYAAAGSAIYASEDAGDHWQCIADGLPAVQALVAA